MGSEMCIRDRYYVRAYATNSAGTGYGENEIFKTSNSDSEEQIIACLLYTSDAADDLLCVDLGGRRIIKKKTIICILSLLPIYHFSLMSLYSTPFTSTPLIQ